MDSDVGMGYFQREALGGGRWLYGLLKGVEDVWLVGWVGTDTGECFASMRSLDVLCCIRGIYFQEYALVVA